MRKGKRKGKKKTCQIVFFSFGLVFPIIPEVLAPLHCNPLHWEMWWTCPNKKTIIMTTISYRQGDW